MREIVYVFHTFPTRNSLNDWCRVRNVFHYHPLAADGTARSSKNVVLCLDRCPDELLLTLSDLALYANKTGSRLCRYDVPPTEYTSRGRETNICPPLPVLPQYVHSLRSINSSFRASRPIRLSYVTWTFNMRRPIGFMCT